MTLPTECQPSEGCPNLSQASANDLPAPSGLLADSVPATLAALAKQNPKHLTPEQRRALDGLYSGDDPTLRLRCMRELSEAEQAHAVELARGGASVRYLVRAFGVSRATAALLWKRARPAPSTPAPAAAEPEPVEHAPMLKAEHAPTSTPVLVVPRPAPAPVKPPLDVDEIVRRCNARAPEPAPASPARRHVHEPPEPLTVDQALDSLAAQLARSFPQHQLTPTMASLAPAQLGGYPMGVMVPRGAK